MEKKQTAVEWMVDILERYIQNLSQDDLENLSNLFEQAKQMEKEQMIEFGAKCIQSHNETYGGK
jgi:thiaminase